jgi:hypothetical protein
MRVNVLSHRHGRMAHKITHDLWFYTSLAAPRRISVPEVVPGEAR